MDKLMSEAHKRYINPKYKKSYKNENRDSSQYYLSLRHRRHHHMVFTRGIQSRGDLRIPRPPAAGRTECSGEVAVWSGLHLSECYQGILGKKGLGEAILTRLQEQSSLWLDQSRS